MGTAVAMKAQSAAKAPVEVPPAGWPSDTAGTLPSASEPTFASLSPALPSGTAQVF